MTDSAGRDAALWALRQRFGDSLQTARSVSIPQVPSAPGAHSLLVTQSGSSPVPLLPGISEAITRLNARIKEVAAGDSPVIVSGETGTEKAFAAKLIHQFSPRAGGPLDKVSVTWKLPPDFGAYFRQCDGGTLIINLRRDFPVELQYTILEILGDAGFADPMTNEIIEANVRLVVTLAQPPNVLRDRVSILPELSEVLKRNHLEIPPLRQRPEDIPALVRYATQRAYETGRSMARGADAQVLALFRQWHWPGNAEDLLILSAEAALNAQSDLICIEDLPDEFLEQIPPDIMEAARAVRSPRASVSAIGNLPMINPHLHSTTPPPDPEPEPEPQAPAEPAPAPIELAVAEFAAGPPTQPDAPPDSPEEVEEKTRRLQRLLTLARRLTSQSRVLKNQVSGSTPPAAGDTRPAELPDDADLLSESLEAELDAGLDSVLALRRQMALLNDRERKAMHTARDLYKRLILLGERTDETLEEEMKSETRELATELEEIDSIIKRVSSRFEKIKFGEKP